MTHQEDTSTVSQSHVTHNGNGAIALPTSANGRPLRPFQIVSLLDVIELDAADFYAMVYRIQLYLGELKTGIEGRTGQATLTSTEQAHARELLRIIEMFARTFGMAHTTRRVYSAMNEASYSATSLEKMQWVIQELNADIKGDLRDLSLMYFPADKVEYLGEWRKRREHLGGLFDQEDVSITKRVSVRFPEANGEITLAGTCYAMEAYTACVFHLMRAVEIGARAMMQKSALDAEQYLNKIPVELCDWKNLLDAFDAGVDALRIGSRTDSKKKEKLEFYSHAVGLFRNFKDAWRNKVSHSRHVYKPGETKDCMDSTRQFMQHLAKKVKEPRRV